TAHLCEDFKCRSSRICIPKPASCDGLAQCPDLSDESMDKEDNSCFQYNSDSFSRIGIILTSALLVSVGLVFAAVIRRTLLERLKKPSKYEVNPGKEVQYSKR
uniref:Low-density lipoprotein receptor domain class A n=1 Tax=Macrostomum lignano TaxID=282301 RepID=A0A1I8IIY1_9PLAT